MADDNRVAERRLEDLLMSMRWHRTYREVYRRRKKKGDAANVALCEQLLKVYYARIRAHCAEHDLELPHDVPPEDAA